MRILLRLAEHRFYIRSPFHVRLVDTLLVMDISIKEVKEFEVILPPPKVATYKINNDMIEVLATYSPEVIIANIVVILN